MPGPFALADAGALHALLVDGGFADVAVSELSVPERAPSFDEWWMRTAALAGPLSMILAPLPEPAKDAIAERLRETTTAYRTPRGIELPGLALVAAGRR